MKTGVHGILTIVLWSLFLALRADALSADAAQSRLSPAASDERTMQTELLEAAVSGSTDRLTELLRRGVSPSVRDENGFTPLYICAASGNAAGVEALLAAGADPDFGTNDETPLDIAVINDHVEVVRQLLAAGAKTETSVREQGAEVPVSAALANAAASESDEVFALVLGSGADVNRCNVYGHRPLLSAAVCGFTERVKTLLERGADVNGRSRRQETALQYAAEEGHLETVKVLIEAGADIDAQDAEGWTALLAAAFQERSEIVALLLSKGANTEIRTAHGDTALLAAAANSGSAAVIETLISGGAGCFAADHDGHGALYHLERNERLQPAEKKRLAELLKEAGAEEEAENDLEADDAPYIKGVPSRPAQPSN